MSNRTTARKPAPAAATAPAPAAKTATQAEVLKLATHIRDKILKEPKKSALLVEFWIKKSSKK